MQEKFDYSKLEFAGKKLYFNKLALTYYPVTDPKDENAFTYIPVWEFTATMQSRRYVVVYINAIDGSLTDVVYWRIFEIFMYIYIDNKRFIW